MVTPTTSGSRMPLTMPARTESRGAWFPPTTPVSRWVYTDAWPEDLSTIYCWLRRSTWYCTGTSTHTCVRISFAPGSSGVTRLSWAPLTPIASLTPTTLSPRAAEPSSQQLEPAGLRCGTSTQLTPESSYFAAAEGANTSATYGLLDVNMTATDLTASFVGTSGGPLFGCLTISKSADNVPPTADFTAATSGLAATFDGSASVDSDQVDRLILWDFGTGLPPAAGALRRTLTAPTALTR